jgi:hypothetical protein
LTGLAGWGDTPALNREGIYMARKFPRRFWLLALPVGVALVASIMVPLALAQGRFAGTTAAVIAGPDAPAPRCSLQSGTPSHPLELNTETLGPRFKSVAMEKEVFTCNSGTQTVDVETFIEIVEKVVDDDNDNNDDRAITESSRVETATCIKDFAGGYVACNNSTVPVRSISAADVFSASCSNQYATQPQDPVAMTTEETGDIVKTIKVEKEALKNCVPAVQPDTVQGTFPADHYLFTEILESKRGGTIKPLAGANGHRFLGFLCFKDPAGGSSNDEPPSITSCDRFTPLSSPPPAG